MGIGTATEKKLCDARIARLKMMCGVLGGTEFHRMSSTVRGEKGEEMRLIDADSLHELIDGGFDLDFDEVPETKRELLRMVDEQPTIDAVPRKAFDGILWENDVMKKQRESIYSKRRNALYGDRLSIDISNMFHDSCEEFIDEFYGSSDWEELEMQLITRFGCEVPFTQAEFNAAKKNRLEEILFDAVYNGYKAKMNTLSERVMPLIQHVYETQGQRFENIAIPITDGKKVLNVIAPLKKCCETGGREVQLSIEKSIALAVIDDAWKEHLRDMDDLKQYVQNASYEQKDPLLVYKLESFELFRPMVSKSTNEIVSFLLKGQLPTQNPDDVKEAKLPSSDMSKMRMGRQEVGSAPKQQQVGNNTQERQITQPIHVEKKVGRNDPCPRGSGKKYKNCHGRMQN